MVKQNKIDYRRESDEKITKMEKDIEYIKDSQIKQDEKFDKFILHIDHKFEEVNTKFDNLPGKFANKYVEKGFWGLIGLVFTTLGVLLLKLLIGY